MLSILKNIGKNKQLEGLIACVEMNMSNNYKDAAQADFKQFAETYASLKEAGRISAKQEEYYDNILKTYSEKLQAYSHKDQKPFWT